MMIQLSIIRESIKILDSVKRVRCSCSLLFELSHINHNIFGRGMGGSGCEGGVNGSGSWGRRRGAGGASWLEHPEL